MLVGKNGGGYQYGGLLAVATGFESGPNGYFRFAESHIAAYQPVHGRWLLHVTLHVFGGPGLVGCLRLNETGLQFGLQVIIG